MNIYDAIDLWATAVYGDATIKTYCTTNYSKGLLVQVDDDAENPISSDDAPFVLMIGYSGGDDSPVAEAKIQEARIVVGCVAPGTPSTPTVTATRSATANGLRKFGAGNLCVDLLDLIVAKIKTVNLTNYNLLSTASYDISGLLLFPMVCAGTTVRIEEYRDTATF